MSYGSTQRKVFPGTSISHSTSNLTDGSSAPSPKEVIKQSGIMSNLRLPAKRFKSFPSRLLTFLPHSTGKEPLLDLYLLPDGQEYLVVE
ncbi:hypothetical protein L5515_017090 [Caenorhabditis briggsae]|uniref:Uncharacterized protein n=1 Tax=Caenorhabditis briggsae TaxID=6238 RepID=A0AAE9FEM9_CAEBR|nr:hypothetical protein L5515_017090 [Caenorhabditis briggsae]